MEMAPAAGGTMLGPSPAGDAPSRGASQEARLKAQSAVSRTGPRGMVILGDSPGRQTTSAAAAQAAVVAEPADARAVET